MASVNASTPMDRRAAQPRRRARLGSWLRGHITTPIQWLFWMPIVRHRNAGKQVRRLEIGQGARRIDGFETLNVIGGRNVDYIADASKRLPFRTGTFDVVYASHVLEHVSWFWSRRVLAEWVRILRPGGRLEIWVPDGLKIARAFVQAEDSVSADYRLDNWWRFNPAHDPCLWMSGRCFSYGDGTGDLSHPNWHRALFSERHLKRLLEDAGLADVRRMSNEEVRGYDHGWINLGMTGTKP